MRKTTKQTGQLAGKYFHSLNGQNQVEWQGIVLGSPEPGYYTVQLFDWLAGQPRVIRIVEFIQLRSWLFYNNGDEMIYSYEHGTAKEGGPYRKYPTKKPEIPSKDSAVDGFNKMREAAK